MDLFGIKKRKAAAEAAKLKEEKIFAKVKEEYKILKARADAKYSESYNNARQRQNDHDNICPKCKSTNVNDRIQRLQGEFSGSISGSRSLFSGSLYGHSSGKIDTNEVNKCNDCGNEWKKYEMHHSYPSEILEMYFQQLVWLMEGYKEALEATIDKNNLDEPYSTDEEKRKALLDKIPVSYRYKDTLPWFEGISIEAVKEIALKEIWKDSYDSYHRDKLDEAWDEPFLINYMNLKHIVI